MAKKGVFFILWLIIGYYLFWELRSLSLPALQMDEASVARGSFATINNYGAIYYDKKIFGRYIPILHTPYQGAGQELLMMPFILLGGLNVFSVRISLIFWGFLTLLLLYIFCKGFLNRKAALMVVFLMAIDLTFITGTKFGPIYGAELNVFLLGSLLCFLKWFKSGKRIYFCIGSFLVGMGQFNKPLFLWYVVSLVIVLPIFKNRLREKFVKKEIIIILLIGVLGFCIGISPLIYYEAKTGFGIIKYAIGHFTQTEYGGNNNLQYFKHLGGRFNNFIGLPTSLISRQICELDNKVNRFIIRSLRGFYLYLFEICLIWHFLTVLFKREGFLIQKKLMLCMFLLIFFQSPFTLSSIKSEHLFLLLPIIKILIGLFLCELMIVSKIFKAFVLAGLVTLLAMHSYVLINYQALMEKTGGILREDSDAIYRVVDYITSKNIKNVIVMELDLRHLCFVLSGGKINESYYEFFEPLRGQEDPESFYAKFRQLEWEMENRDNVYLFRSPGDDIGKCHEQFLELVQKKKKEVFEIKRFYRRDGRWLYVLYGVSVITY